MHARSLASIWLLIAGCGSVDTVDSQALGPNLMVGKVDVVNNCVASCLNGGMTVPFLPALPAPSVLPPCATAPAHCGFVGGADRAYVIVDYGQVPFADNVAVTPPTITMIADGAESAAPGTIEQPPPVGSRVFFTDEFTVPFQVVHDFGVRAVGGVGFQAAITSFDVELPTPMVTVSGACMPDNTCVAGVGKATFTIVAPLGLTPPTAVLTSQVNTVPQIETANVALMQVGQQLQGIGTLSVPTTNSFRSGTTDVWNVNVAIGPAVAPPITLSLKAPNLVVAMSGSVTMTGPQSGTGVDGVGSVTFTIDAPTALQTSTATVTTTLNGVPLAQSGSVAMTPKGGSLVEGTVTLPVPPSNGLRTGTTDLWTVNVAMGTVQALPIMITLSDPRATVSMSGAVAPTGSGVTGTGVGGVGTAFFTIDAPLGLAVTNATVSSILNGVPQLQVISVPLVPKGSMIEGIASLPVPQTNSFRMGATDVWEVDVVLGSMPVATLDIALSDPVISVTISGSCTSMGQCFADVGAATFTITAPGELELASTTAVLTSKVNTLPQLATANLTLQLAGGSLQGGAPLQVPASNSLRMGATDVWEVDLSIGSLPVRPVFLTMSDSPLVAVSVANCSVDAGAGCSLTAGSDATVIVTAPADTNESQAIITTSINSVPQGSAITQPFGPKQQLTRTVIVNVPVPNQPGATWIVSGQVGTLVRQADPINIM